MDINVNVDNLDTAIAEVLKDWSQNEVHKATNEAIKETAKVTAKLLKQGGPYKERTGKYTKDWSYKIKKGAYNHITQTETWVVYNKKNYRLTHLLEKGHQVMRGGRKVGEAKKFEHIFPAYEFAEDYLIMARGRHIEMG